MREASPASRPGAPPAAAVAGLARVPWLWLLPGLVAAAVLAAVAGWRVAVLWQLPNLAVVAALAHLLGDLRRRNGGRRGAPPEATPPPPDRPRVTLADDGGLRHPVAGDLEEPCWRRSPDWACRRPRA